MNLHEGDMMIPTIAFLATQFDSSSCAAQFDPIPYNEHGKVQFERALENLSGWTFDPSDIVLDIGSGNGKVTFNISEHVPYGKVIGLDINPEMVEFANQNYQVNSNIEFIVGDACNLPFRGVFDKITSFATLSWIPLESHQEIFNNIYLALKPQGKALLRMSSEGKRPFNEILNKVIETPSWSQYFENFISPASYQSENNLRSIISQANLKVIKIDDATKISNFSDKEKFCTWLMSWLPHRNQIPENLREKFMMEVIDRYCEEMGFVNNISITMPGLLVEIQKS